MMLEQKLGDCFESAVGVMMERHRNDPEAEGGYILVHGWPIGQGPIEGIKHAHAWVEFKDACGMRWVWDKSNGRDIDMPAALYYKIGSIDENECRRYTFEEMTVALLDNGTYGPWENAVE